MIPAKVTVAQIESPDANRRDKGLGPALVPGLPIERFNRTWRLEIDATLLTSLRNGPVPDFVAGRLGYDKTTGEAPAWDEKLGRFVVTRQHDGDVVPFLVRLSDLEVAFQRTSKIRRQSFIGALQKLLREGAQNDGWRVRDRTTSRSWDEFRQVATRVVEVTITVLPTNPGWAGQDLFEPYIDELQGDRARITVTGDDLNLDSKPIEQARTHALERGYGELHVKAQTADGFPVVFDSEDPVPVIDATAERQEGGEVSYDALRDALSRTDDAN